jgi:hypothetical protein
MDDCLMMDEADYLKLYDDEWYLLDVGRRFRVSRKIDAPDFYMLLIWKANRAKNRHRDRLKSKAGGKFKDAVEKIASELHASTERKHRLQILMRNWEFALPTATAILTILYPEDFTVYDYRVCDEVGQRYTPWLSFSEKLWGKYEQFQNAVISNTPGDLSLRDKDRFLIARSIRKEIEVDCIA